MATIRQNAAEIYEGAHARNVWMDAGDECIHLFKGEVVEHDSPGVGRSRDAGGIFVNVSGEVVLRKELAVEDPRTDRVQVAFVGKEKHGHAATLRIGINGHEIQRPPSSVACPDARQYFSLSERGGWNWSRWYYVMFPTEWLTAGTNVITCASKDGVEGWQVMAAEDRHFAIGSLDRTEVPNTSAKSVDGGRTWDCDRIGEDDFGGEYVVRLLLERYREEGTVVSEVFDAAGEDGEVVTSRCTVRRLALGWEGDAPEGTTISLRARTGSTPFYEEGNWSDWDACEPGRSLNEVRGRYLQWEATLTTEDPSRTPALKAVAAETEIEPRGGWAEPLRIVEAHNARILRDSYGFVQEDYTHPKLRELRETFELDAVVAGAGTEFEKIERLLQWAYLIPLGECSCFPWDALDWLILERDEDGAIRMNEYAQRRRDKMCLFPNVVLMQACQSFGIPARHVNFHSEGISGHEVVEVWSNDYRKWVHLDATRDYYWYDPGSRVPLNTLEIREALVERLERPETWRRPYLFHQDVDAMKQDLPIAFREGENAHSVEEGARHILEMFCHFRIVPRSNVYSSERPLPISQGVEVWAWDGYLNWADERVPPLEHFSHHTNRVADMYPTQNQVRYTLMREETTGKIEVYLETDTPNFAGYLVSIDRGAWEQRPDRFVWPLHEGTNSLQVRTRNTAGVEGVVSSVTIARD